jgi:predicted ABC-class ATPase
MKTRDEILAILEKGVWDGGDYSVPLAAQRLTVELLLDIRDLLGKRNRETVVDFVPPDYGREDKLV